MRNTKTPGFGLFSGGNCLSVSFQVLKFWRDASPGGHFSGWSVTWPLGQMSGNVPRRVEHHLEDLIYVSCGRLYIWYIYVYTIYIYTYTFLVCIE